MNRDFEVRDVSLAEMGERQLEQMKIKMPVLQLINLRFQMSRIFEGLRISVCLHLTKETAAFVLALKSGGADIYMADSVPGTVNDEVMAALAVNHGIHVFADSTRTVEENEEYLRHVLNISPDIIVDESATLMGLVKSDRNIQLSSLIGSTEQTTGGITVIRELERNNQLNHPVFSINDSKSKHMFDNHFGVGQTFIQTCLKADNSIFGGKTIVICGFGWCGTGAARLARGMGANVIVTEIDPMKALDAHLLGYRVMPIREAAQHGDIFATFTGNTKVIDFDSICQMKDGAIVMNCGSGDTEVDVKAIKENSLFSYDESELSRTYKLNNGKEICVLCDGRPANLVGVGGNPGDIMDLSFSIHAMAIEYLLKNKNDLSNRIYSVPKDVDEEISKLKLLVYGVTIDTQTQEQREYAGRYLE